MCGSEEDAKEVLQETLLDYLRGKSILIILDNCEHLLETCAGLADLLLGRTPAIAPDPYGLA